MKKAILNSEQQITVDYIRSQFSEILKGVRWGASRDGVVSPDTTGQIVVRASDGFSTKNLSLSLKTIEAIEALMVLDAIERYKEGV